MPISRTDPFPFLRTLIAFLLLTATLAVGWAQTPVPDSFNPGADGHVRALAVQNDAKVLVGGGFSTLAGQPRNRVGRLNVDGTLDTAFNPAVGGSSPFVYCLGVQPDGKILVGGTFTNLAGLARTNLGRLNPDGTADASFNPGADGTVYCLALQADGKILVGGAFYALGGLPRNRIGRLNPDGTLDSSFYPGADSTVYSLALQPDGKVLVGGSFSSLGGQSRSRIGRLNADGTMDTAFNPGVGGSYPYVECLAAQPDGKILLGGYFTTLGGQTRTNLGRLNADGSVDSAFNPGASSEVVSLAIQADGKILVGGYFLTLGGQPRNRIGRLNADGSLDPTFDPGASSAVYGLALQAEGKILVGGSFGTLGGQPRNSIGRLNNTGAATESLGVVGSTLTWLRAGTGPEVSRTDFDASTNGVDWFVLGTGTRITGGWQLNGVTVPGSASVRGRGPVAGGYYNGSSWFVETIIGKAVITVQPSSRTNDAGTVTSFSVGAGGTTPLGYQWRKEGVNLGDAGNISGARTALLAVSNVFRAHAGSYSVVVSNSFGSVTSLVAALTVVDPVIRTNPAPVTANAGQNASFSVGASGTAPLGYQWRKNGVGVTGATGSTLTVTNVQAADAGSAWDVVVSNGYGSVTSTVALLTVNLATTDAFNPQAGGDVYALAVQPDGKVLMGGYFATLGSVSRASIGRLNGDGTLDMAFNPGVSGGSQYSSPYVTCLAVQPDGKIIVGGWFTNMAGLARTNLGRLNPDGSADLAFNPGTDSGGRVYSLAVQADGKILVGGDFSTLGGQSRSYLARLNADGTLDSSFDPEASYAVYSLALQSDGKLLVGGGFSSLGGQTRRYLGRLNADGTVDSGFNPGAGNYVYSLALQPDGKVLVGGGFSTLGGQPRSGIGRLDSDGTLDSSFNPGVSGSVYSFALQADGRILVGGSFSTLGGQPRGNLGRLNADGSPDTTLDPGASSVVYGIAVQADGKVLVGGGYSSLGGQSRSRIGRLNNTGTATESLNVAGSTITWLRGGTGPEVSRTTFEASTNRSDWMALGTGTRISGGWQLSGVIIPSGASVRGRGIVSGGYYNGSSWFVETFGGVPLIASQPASRTNSAGTVAKFTVLAGGSPPLGYQWRKGVVNLGDAGNISGAQTATLTVSNVFGPDAGGYSVVVTNSYGSVTSLVATLTVVDPVITTNPASVTGIVGQNAAFSVGAMGTAPLSYQWRKNGTNVAWATGSALTVTNVQTVDAGSAWDVVVSNGYGSTTSTVAWLTVNLATADAFNPTAGNAVYALAIQPDGKVLVGGYFSTLGGQPRNRLGRLNADGTVDASFNPGVSGSSPYVDCLGIQPDGKILVGGTFTNLAGLARTNIGRLNADGTVDASFNPGASGSVYCMALQTDGKILVGGYFTTLGGLTRNYLGRLNPDGTADSAFNPGAGSSVNSLALQPDGKILVGGGFSSLSSQTRYNLGRLNADGTLDSGFNPGASGSVYSLTVQPDGKILVGGYFTTLGAQPRNYLGRLNTDGTVDSTFNPGASGSVSAFALQADGKVLVGGYFSALGGQPRRNLGRLNADGSPDTTFDPGAGYSYDNVNGLALQADGKILVGGYFSTLGGQSRAYIGRLNNTGTATESLSVAGSTITWLRGGTGPEVSWTTFEASTNRSDWADLGIGTRIAGGWQLSGATVPSGASVRGRGVVSGGFYNGSSWFVETLAGAPLLTGQPANRTNSAGTVATFTVLAGGSPPFGYQWRKGAVNLGDAGNISGAQLATLTLSNVFGSDAGGYSVVVTNSYGSVTSLVATLTVVDPVIITNPASVTANVGQNATFSVGVVGTASLSFQWRKGGVGVTGATSQTMTVTNVQAADAGSAWDVVVSNGYGSTTSTVAWLTVNLATTDAFNPTAGNSVYAFAVQPDGKVLVGGYFSTLGGQSRNRLGRLNADGTVDASFNPGVSGSSPYVYCLATQPDGKILVGGVFTNLAGLARTNIGRLNADGTVDASFNSGAGGTVNCLALQADGKILVGGYFTTLAGQSRSNLGRLDADGTVDSSFSPAANNTVLSLAVQPDGKILVGGGFYYLGGQYRSYLGRLNADGTVDNGFNPGADSWVRSLTLQADGNILVGGQFSTLAGQPRSSLGRLSADGTLDSGFNPVVISSYRQVFCLAVQTDGKILVGGSFSSISGAPRSNLARLNADGPPDTTFDPGASSSVYGLAVQADGKILVGSGFGTLGGQSRSYIGRLNNTGAATESLGVAGPSITWLRGGAGPEVSRTVFEASTNGANWFGLGTGARIVGGWQLSGVTVPGGASVRARGMVSGGYDNGSSWFVETLAGAPMITGQPASRTNNTSTVATFTVLAGGSPPLGYQWLKNGAPLPNGGSVTGTTSENLTLANVQAGDAAAYSVVVTNTTGAVTSQVATLTVWMPPSITAQPQSRTNLSGTAASFSLTAAGTAPLAYQWRFNGTNLSGATASNYPIASVQLTNAGNYNVVVTNVAGSVTSAVASLTVWVPPAITAQPQSRTNLSGTAASFSATAVGTAPLTYQWRFNGTNLSGATASNYPIASVQLTNAGNYDVVVANVAGSETSAVASLTVWVPPAITAQPQSRTNLPGTAASFSVRSTGTAPLAYQWRFNGANLAGATTSNYPIASVQLTNAGNYDVVVANVGGSVTSQVARLTVLSTAHWVFNDLSTRGNWKGVYGTAGQWMVGLATNLPAGVQVAASGGTYFTFNANTPDALALEYPDNPSVTNRFSACLYSTTNFELTVTLPAGVTNRVAFYLMEPDGGREERFELFDAASQTLLDSQVVSGLTNGLYLVYDAVGSVRAKVTKVAGANALLSAAFFGTATAQAPEVRAQPPPAVGAALGQAIVLGAGANGSPPLSFQWRKGGVPLPGTANLDGIASPVLRFSSVTATDAGAYALVVTNAYGSVTSIVATLTILQPPTVTITSPTTAPTYSTSASVLSIGGSAVAGNAGLSQVTWSNDRGGSGTASGTTVWSVDNIPLQTGANVITVTARDTAGNTGVDTLTVTATFGCHYSLSVPSASVGPGGGSGSFSVTATTGCPWSATADVVWLHTSSSGSGDGEVSYTVDANPNAGFRTGTIAVGGLGGQTFTITQAGPGWISHPAFGALWDTGTGWYGGSAYGWMWFHPGGQWIWSSSLQGWLAVVDPNSRTLWSTQFRWLTPSPNDPYNADTTAIGPIYLGQYNGTAITDGWVVSDRFGYVWANGDGKWFYSTTYGWLGVTDAGGIWCVTQGKFL